jgi:hypothetical protein
MEEKRPEVWAIGMRAKEYSVNLLRLYRVSDGRYINTVPECHAYMYNIVQRPKHEEI